MTTETRLCIKTSAGAWERCRFIHSGLYKLSFVGAGRARDEGAISLQSLCKCRGHGKPYSQYLAFVVYFGSGKHHCAVKGINLIHTDVHGQHLPVNFRVSDKSEGKTRNDYFLDMLEEVLALGACQR